MRRPEAIRLREDETMTTLSLVHEGPPIHLQPLSATILLEDVWENGWRPDMPKIGGGSFRRTELVLRCAVTAGYLLQASITVLGTRK